MRNAVAFGIIAAGCPSFMTVGSSCAVSPVPAGTLTVFCVLWLHPASASASGNANIIPFFISLVNLLRFRKSGLAEIVVRCRCFIGRQSDAPGLVSLPAVT